MTVELVSPAKYVARSTLKSALRMKLSFPPTFPFIKSGAEGRSAGSWIVAPSAAILARTALVVVYTSSSRPVAFEL